MLLQSPYLLKLYYYKHLIVDFCSTYVLFISGNLELIRTIGQISSLHTQKKMFKKIFETLIIIIMDGNSFSSLCSLRSLHSEKLRFCCAAQLEHCS
mmetsp:Transcript_13076/g.32036  ORF Transcript_13076/g.32036 Transcript_13076/m.32036 type:complete len:96 (+) Transcript_13076:119-406(+)